MAKISRVFQKVFGISGNVSYFGQPGSLPAGTKVNTQDPATIQGLGAFLTGLSAIVKSGTYKVAMEDLNSLFLLAFYQIAYLMQAGIAEWDTSTTYYVGSLVNVNGSIYKSLTDDNTGNNPASDATNWALTAGVPVGIVQDFAGPTANIPAGFLVCDGAAVSRSTYANLFAAIGTSWGVGNNSTTFNIPNLKGAVTAGYDAAQTEFNAVGKKGGEKTHLLTGAESGTSVHSHPIPAGPGDQGGAYNTNSDTPPNRTLATGNSTAADAESAHNNLQPYGTVLKIIKY